MISDHVCLALGAYDPGRLLMGPLLTGERCGQVLMVY